MATQEDWDNFAKDVIPKLEKRGYLKNSKIRTYIFIGIICVLVLFLGFLSTQIYDEKFKSIDNSTVMCNNTNYNMCPTAPACPVCPTHVCNETFVCSINYNTINFTNSSS